MEDLKQQAIEAVKAYLIDLLKKSEYCDARSIGDVLAILVRKSPSTGEQEGNATGTGRGTYRA